MPVLTTFIVKKTYKPEPNRNLEKTNRNRTVSSEPRVTAVFRLTVAALGINAVNSFNL